MSGRGMVIAALAAVCCGSGQPSESGGSEGGGETTAGTDASTSGEMGTMGLVVCEDVLPIDVPTSPVTFTLRNDSDQPVFVFGDIDEPEGIFYLLGGDGVPLSWTLFSTPLCRDLLQGLCPDPPMDDPADPRGLYARLEPGGMVETVWEGWIVDQLPIPPAHCVPALCDPVCAGVSMPTGPVTLTAEVLHECFSEDPLGCVCQGTEQQCQLPNAMSGFGVPQTLSAVVEHPGETAVTLVVR